MPVSVLKCFYKQYRSSTARYVRWESYHLLFVQAVRLNMTIRKIISIYGAAEKLNVITIILLVQLGVNWSLYVMGRNGSFLGFDVTVLTIQMSPWVVWLRLSEQNLKKENQLKMITIFVAFEREGTVKYTIHKFITGRLMKDTWDRFRYQSLFAIPWRLHMTIPYNFNSGCSLLQIIYMWLPKCYWCRWIVILSL